MGERAMKSRWRIRGWRVIAFVLVGALLLTTRQVAIPIPSGGVPALPEQVDDLIRQLSTPGGKVEYFGSFNPGGPNFIPSAPMRDLTGFGRAIQPRLLDALGDPRVRNEVALVLAEVGDKEALPHLIEYLPTTDKLSKEGAFSTMCLLYALWQLTGIELGIDSKFSPDYTPEFRVQWRTWYETNRDFLYTPSIANRTTRLRNQAAVLVDVEAKLAGRPTVAYRQENPWVAYEEIKTWCDDPAYERKLKTFCYSVIMNPSSGGDRYTSRDTIYALVHVRDPRTTAALRALCAKASDAYTADELLWAIKERADPAFLPFIEKAPHSADLKEEANSYGPRRRIAADQIRLLNKYRDVLAGVPLGAEWQKMIAECRESQAGVDTLLRCLRKRDYFLPEYLRVAGYVDREQVRACVKQMAVDETLDDTIRTLAYAALARLGEPGSLDHLRRALDHKSPGVRVAAAEGLWRVGSRDGYKTLLEILDVRPIESGGEGVESGNGANIKVTALRGTNVEHIRAACGILGEMGDRSAIEPLKRLLALNINGVSATGGSGTGWSGRPDVVALARLRDFSGVEVLRASLREGDRLDVLGSWWYGGDYVAIGQRRFIPDLLPMFEHHDEGKRILAARNILLLLASGK